MQGILLRSLSIAIACSALTAALVMFAIAHFRSMTFSLEYMTQSNLFDAVAGVVLIVGAGAAMWWAVCAGMVAIARVLGARSAIGGFCSTIVRKFGPKPLRTCALAITSASLALSALPANAQSYSQHSPISQHAVQSQSTAATQFRDQYRASTQDDSTAKSQGGTEAATKGGALISLKLSSEILDPPTSPTTSDSATSSTTHSGDVTRAPEHTSTTTSTGSGIASGATTHASTTAETDTPTEPETSSNGTSVQVSKEPTSVVQNVTPSPETDGTVGGETNSSPDSSKSPATADSQRAITDSQNNGRIEHDNRPSSQSPTAHQRSTQSPAPHATSGTQNTEQQYAPKSSITGSESTTSTDESRLRLTLSSEATAARAPQANALGTAIQGSATTGSGSTGAAQLRDLRTVSTSTAGAESPSQKTTQSGSSKNSAGGHLNNGLNNKIVVADGDCLWDIARDQLPVDANAREIAQAWQEIYAANKRVIGQNPDILHAGTTLHIPELLSH